MTLVAVQGSIMLEANAASSFKRVNAKCGGRLRITGPYGGHRYEADQAYLRTGYERRMAGWKGYGHFNYAAKPRQSNHEGKAPEWEGFALDISNYRQYPGLHAAMVAEGWERDPVELWHYNYRGRRTQIVGVAGNVITITPPPRKRLQMSVGQVKLKGDPAVYGIDLIDPHAPLRHLGTGDFLGGVSAGIIVEEIGLIEWQKLLRQRGVLIVDEKYRRPIPFSATPPVAPGYTLLDYKGDAVARAN